MLVLALVLAWSLVGEPLRRWWGLPGEGAAPGRSADQLRVATWNLRNFPEEGHDLARLAARLPALAADVIAVQEIHDAEQLKQSMPGWELVLSATGGRNDQRLGFLYDPAVFELIGAPREHEPLTMGGQVRPGLSGYLRARGGGPDFHVLVVHLKARDEGYALRRSQWEVLAGIVEEIARDDDDVIVLGDFNATGPTRGGPDEELQALDARLGAVGLQRVVNSSGCSAYWDGGRRDAWHEPSLLDLVWVRGRLAAEVEKVHAEPLLHCARHACRPFRSTPTHPERDYADLSDHCPVIFDFERGPDDDP
ncbi:Metal-dependent hydrolase, endonuclease/exonuclease/phosphatase family [Nannocystis exedens]|uniref:Metal-dependent hydrolase, endonuclease/exonuclease/phosphatase family n=1 Tax=Nannocystis exedens TaxID=54 RepID=A0A1I2AGP3_9BACT|nr:Endonuclease/Exonuclease/phosphatase family protein [Nannocystis exedens]SFE42887.1 Metal-dependent hydrolase, endonuclease/exonuclease/phosphatase family [Nannocystis exedens]